MNIPTSSYSAQGTTFTETTFAGTMGLAMHNAITNQQQSQVTTAATVASMCAKILATSVQPNST
ncbi:RebB family R body protein [Photobacterium leiognathi]|uniref:RebB family R body protein n=1 Tax=Photobacterium leiognathi TaxID=553611 RepID=UPI002981D66A|nr:RebB family R body protein [Photobacterium leiognathi]